MVETDPEIPLHHMMPKAPIIQLVADGQELKKIVKGLLRLDADYLIMAEARDGIALKIALSVASRGTKRVKMTYHTSDPTDFCYDVASEIVQEFGGDTLAYTVKMAKSYHYIFDFAQMKDKSLKKLKGIYEIRFNHQTFEVSMVQICKYDIRSNTWKFKYTMGRDKEEVGAFENPEALQLFHQELQRLEQYSPLEEDNITVLPYLNLHRR